MSKKALVRFDPKKLERKSSDFLVPVRNEMGEFKLISLKNGKVSDFGLVVFTGREVGAKDMFSKLVDSGYQMASVDLIMRGLEAFVSQLPSFSIGNILEIENVVHDELSFELVKTNLKSGSSKSRGLP